MNSLKSIERSYQQIYDMLSAQVLSTYGDLKTKVKSQNNIIDNNIQSYANELSTDVQKSYYETQSTQNIRNINTYLLYIYYFAVVVFALYIFFIDETIVFIYKIILIILFIIYPYFIYFIEQVIYSVGLYIYSLATAKIYTNVYLNNY